MYGHGRGHDLITSPRSRNCRARGGRRDLSTSDEVDADRRLENELKDPKTPFEYFLPRPLRLVLLGGTGASCFIACLLGLARIFSESSTGEEGNLPNLAVNAVGLAASVFLFRGEQASAEKRVERRKEIRKAQIEFGDREVYVNAEGQRMSKLKEVDDDWILRRLERWGQRDLLPLVGPVKGEILQNLITERSPKRVVEVGSFLGYSAILIAQVLPPGASLVTIENDLKFVLATKRFLWQASQGKANDARAERLGSKVRVEWGKAQEVLPRFDAGIDFLFLDGRPKEYLEYLKAAEERLNVGACIVADNAGVFADGGLKPYLEYVRTSPLYRSTFIESTLEWRSDVMDGLEVTEYIGRPGEE